MIGGVGMWSVPVSLPAVQAEFAVDRAAASMPYTVTMIGFAFAGVALGRMVDRLGIFVPLVIGTLMMCAGYTAASMAPNLTFYVLAQGILVGGGSAVFFAPLIADMSHWFDRRRGIAVAVVAAGNYLAGVIWPTPLQHFTEVYGWRAAHQGIAVICFCLVMPLVFLLRRPAPLHGTTSGSTHQAFMPRELGISKNTLQAILCIAGVGCCVAMAMPQVHIVAYCGDLGYGVARGAEMLSLMLGFGIFSRLASGFIADRIGGVATLLLGSILQGSTLVLYFLFDGLTSLYVISALFGLVQGGIVPSYAIIVREYFPPKEAATRVGITIMATLFGMALGGWMSGAIFDLTGSYRAAFANGIAWNLLNVSIVLWLMLKPGRTERGLKAA
jgi:MFS family permease